MWNANSKRDHWNPCNIKLVVSSPSQLKNWSHVEHALVHCFSIHIHMYLHFHCFCHHIFTNCSHFLMNAMQLQTMCIWILRNIVHLYQQLGILTKMKDELKMWIKKMNFIFEKTRGYHHTAGNTLVREVCRSSYPQTFSKMNLIFYIWYGSQTDIMLQTAG